MIDNWGTLTIESGSYSGGLNVVKSEEDSTLNINGGRFELSYATSGYTGVVFAYGNTTITGGEFIQSLTTTGRWNHPQVVATGVVDGHTAITRVTGGHFVNKLSRENIFRGIGKGTSDNFKVSGGTFNKSISEGYCADGFIPTKNADGTYGVKEVHYVAQIGSKKYETLADAVRLAAKGKTITLLTDVEQNTQLAINKNITLDLNGKTIKNTVDIWGDNANAILSITNGAKVTITGNGTIDAKENDCYTINVVKGDLAIESGTFYGNVSVSQVQEGTLSVKGGTFDLHQKWEGSSEFICSTASMMRMRTAVRMSPSAAVRSSASTPAPPPRAKARATWLPVTLLPLTPTARTASSRRLPLLSIPTRVQQSTLSLLPLVTKWQSRQILSRRAIPSLDGSLTRTAPRLTTSMPPWTALSPSSPCMQAGRQRLSPVLVKTGATAVAEATAAIPLPMRTQTPAPLTTATTRVRSLQRAACPRPATASLLSVAHVLWLPLSLP